MRRKLPLLLSKRKRLRNEFSQAGQNHSVSVWQLGVFGCAGSFHTEKDSPMNFPRPGKIIRPLAGRSRGIVGGLDAEKAYMMNFRKAQTASTFAFQRRKKLANEFSQAEKNHLATVWQELWVLGTWRSKKCPKLVPPTTRIVELRTDYAATTRRLRGDYAANTRKVA